MSFPSPSIRQARIIWMALTGLSVALLIVLIIALVWLLGRVINALSMVLWPLAVAGVIAYLVDPVVDFLERKGVPRGRSIISVFLLSTMLVALLFSSVVPQLIRETRNLFLSLPALAQKAQERTEHFLRSREEIVQKFLGAYAPAPVLPAEEPGTNGVLLEVTTNPPPRIIVSTNVPSIFQSALDSTNFQSATGWVAKGLTAAVTWLVNQLGKIFSWFGILAGLVLVPVYAFYFLLEKRNISSRWTNYLPVADSAFKEELVFVLNSINNYLIAFFRGQVLVAICDGIMYTIGFLLIGLPYAVLLGVAAIFLTLIPYLGAIVTCLAALIIAAIQYGDWLHPLLVLVVFTVVQTLEGFIISPQIMGGRVGLHPVTIIIAVVAGTTLLGGILGGILAIPVTAVLRVLMFRYIWKKRAEIEQVT